MTKAPKTLNKLYFERNMIKDEELVMKLGDRLRLIVDMDTSDWDEDTSIETITHTKAASQIYEAAGRKNAGWDLVKLFGEGPNEVRFLNGDVLRNFEILHQDGTITRCEPDDADPPSNDASP